MGEEVERNWQKLRFLSFGPEWILFSPDESTGFDLMDDVVVFYLVTVAKRFAIC